MERLNNINTILNKFNYVEYNFEDIFEDITRKGRKIKTTMYLDDGRYPVIDQSNNFVSGYINENEGLFENSPAIIFGDHTRCLKYIDFPIFLGADGVKLLKNKLGEEKVITRYLYYCLLNSNIPNTGYNRHYKYLKEIKLKIHPLETQKKIVAVLDKAQALIDAREEQIRLMDELIQAQFIEMFGDPVRNLQNHNVYFLEELCSDIVDCPHSTPKNYVESSNYPAIRTTEIRNGRIDWTEMRYVTFEEYCLRTKRLVPKENDIVYGREGSYGDAVLLPSGFHFCLGQRVMLLRANVSICYPEFLWYSVRSDYVYQQAKKKNIGATVGHVNVADIKKFRIMLPDKNLQLDFISFLNKTDGIREKIMTSINELITTQQAIMQQYFG